MRPRRPVARRGRRGRLRAWLALGAVAAVAVILALGWLLVVYPGARGPARGRAHPIEFDAASTLEDAARQLSAAGLVQEPRLFALYARVLGAGSRLRGGRVLVTDDMSVRELLRRIASGYGATELRVTIPEGFSRYDIARRLAEWNVCDEGAFLRATSDPRARAALDPRARTVEGYLFPDTYRLRDDASAHTIVRRLLDNGQRKLHALVEHEASAFAALQARHGFGFHELVTLASIVEREARVPAEQPIIAGVFLNRLHDETFTPHRLQADPTVAYGCLVAPALHSCAAWDGRRITRAMTADPGNPYNTYRHEGLPPGPIASPGLGALRAVLHPARHDYLYFVARGDGHHEFSATLQAHNEAVARHALP